MLDQILSIIGYTWLTASVLSVDFVVVAFLKFELWMRREGRKGESHNG